MALTAITLSACSASPKSNPPTASNPAPVAAVKTNPVEPPAIPPSVDPVAKVVSDPVPTTPLATTPTPVKAPTKPRVALIPAPMLITIQNFEFKPATLTVKKGQTVKWVNKDSAPHTVTSDSFKSNSLQQNSFFTTTFDKAGSFAYHCTFHPSMKGGIIVKQ